MGGVGRRRIWALLLVCFLCTALIGCKGGEDKAATPGSTSSVAPSDLFFRHPSQATTPAPPPESRPLRLLVVGDSLSISLGEQLERALSGAVGIDFARDGTRSTGLTRPELLDWPAHLRELVAQTPPDVVVIMIGANDVMPITGPDGSHIYFDNPAWPEAYAAKAAELLAICRTANPAVRIYWVGVPTMGDAELAHGTLQVNTALATMCRAAPECRFIDTNTAFSDASGHFSRRGRDSATGENLVLRTADGVHMTENGAKLLAGVVLAGLSRQEKLPPNAAVDELRAFARDVHPVIDDTPPPQPAAPTVKRQPTAKPGKKTYSVKNGDTLTTIARRLGVSAQDLADVNPRVDPKRLSLGQTLRIPAKH